MSKMTKALERADHTVVRFSELVRLRNADLELTLLRQAMKRALSQPERDAVELALKTLDEGLPF